MTWKSFPQDIHRFSTAKNGRKSFDDDALPKVFHKKYKLGFSIVKNMIKIYTKDLTQPVSSISQRTIIWRLRE